jgi:hypothetical protein
MKIKFVLIIIATLVIGFIIGFITNGQITKSKIRNFVKTGTHEGFKGRYYRILQPDDEQRKSINPILDKYGVIIHENVTTMQQQMKDTHEEMLNEIEPYLNEEQKERLSESIKKFERRERMKFHHNKGPEFDNPGRRKDGWRKDGRRPGDCQEYFQ